MGTFRKWIVKVKPDTFSIERKQGKVTFYPTIQPDIVGYIVTY